MQRRNTFILILALLALRSGASAEQVDFQTQLLPLLEQRCFKCHSSQAKRPKAGLRLDDPKLLSAGGKSGPVIVPGKLAESELYARISLPADNEDRMPPPGQGEGFSGEQLKLFSAWIEQGASYGDWSGVVHGKASSEVAQGDPVFSIGARATVAPRIPARERPELEPIRPREYPSDQIDELIEKRLAAAGQQPNPDSGDDVFCRRVYLDVAGRIPTYDELTAFRSSPRPDKRYRLIEELLASEAHVLRDAEWWADLLRVTDGKRQMKSEYYMDYILKSLRENKPYDVWVREMITADGYFWDGGKSFYYNRDEGMPLDHKANEMQVFLGTQMVCAQCHNHPSDVWSQKDYYQMAAYTQGVEALRYPSQQAKEFRGLARRGGDMADGKGKAKEKGKGKNEKGKARPGNRPAAGRDGGEIDGEKAEALARLKDMTREEREQLRQGTQDILFLLQRRVHDGDRKLTYGADYRYDDMPKDSPVQPRTPFGDEAPVRKGDDPVQIWADWLTSPRNPRFTTVIVNRIWKKVMGRGLIEPVDDLKGTDSKCSNPELLAYLEELLIRLEYDLRAFEQVLLKTRTYGREAGTLGAGVDGDYHFPGPLLRRMTAEQIWDSMMTLLVPEIDRRVGRTFVDLELRRKNLAALPEMSITELLDAGAKAGAARSQLVGARKEMEEMRGQIKQAQMAGDDEQANELETQVRDRGRELRKAREESFNPESWKYPVPAPRDRLPDGDRWDAQAMRGFVRAALLPSPAPAGHFLREFGQSDREIIDNSLHDASVPQALALMNGPYSGMLLQRDSALMSAIRDAQSPGERVSVLFLTVLGREPTREESEALVELGRRADEEDGAEADAPNRRRRDRDGKQRQPQQAYQGLEDVLWALLNTREFLFVK